MTDVDVSRTDLDGFTGAVIRPQDAGYPAARRVWKGMIDRYPSMIVRPESSDDVAIAVTFARDRGLPLAIRGGGHNVAGSGVCDRGVVIDLRELRGVAVDPVARTVTGGGGCTWGEFDAAAAEHGLATTGGLISSTGVGGLTLGGGIGWLARRYGFSSDNLRRAEVVTADGRIVVADDDTNPDLFWALRGGGGNFGVVTELTFHAHPVDTVLGGILLYRSERAAEILAQYATWAAGIPDEMATLATFLTAPPEPVVPPELRGRPAFAVVLCHLGDHTQGRAALDRLRAGCPPDADLVQPMPYPSLQRMLDASAPHGWRGYWKSGYIRRLGPDLQRFAVAAARTMPPPFSQIHIQQLGGAMATGSAGAVGHRDSAYVVNLVGSCHDAADDAAMIAWVRVAWAELEPAITGTYVNFLDGDDATRVAGAYEPTAFARLKTLKRQWDPTNLFHINHNIPVE